MTSEVKIYGIAHTAQRLVDFMVQSSIGLLKKSSVSLQEITALDPFTGDGVFLGSLLAHGVKHVTAYEIRREQYEQTSNKYSRFVFLRCVDAFKMHPQNCNLFIGNPPYGKCAKDADIDRRIRETYGGEHCTKGRSIIIAGRLKQNMTNGNVGVIAEHIEFKPIAKN